MHAASIRELCKSHYTPAQIAAWAAGLEPAATCVEMTKQLM